MPLIQAPQIAQISSTPGLKTDISVTNIPQSTSISSDALPYLRVGGTLVGERGMNISGSRDINPLLSMKSDTEIAAVNAMKVKEYKGGLLSQGYSEIAPNVLSKRTNPSNKSNRKYDVINIDPQTGDVVSNILGEQQVGLFQLQNKLSGVNWRRMSMSDRNRLEGQARKLGFDIDNLKGQIVPIGYKIGGGGKLIRKSPSLTGGWFGTPEVMASIQRAQHPELFDYAVGRAIERDKYARSPAGMLNSMFQVTPEGKIISTSKYQDYLNMNLASQRANERKYKIYDSTLNNFKNSLFSQDKMSLIKGDTNTAIKDFIWGKGNR